MCYEGEERRDHSKQTLLLNRLIIYRTTDLAKRRKGNQGLYALIQCLTNRWRMLFKRTMTEDIQRFSCAQPLRQLFCPLIEKGDVHIHTRMTNIAHKEKICRTHHLHREVRFALTSLEHLLLLGTPNSDRTRIHNHPGNLKIMQYTIESLSLLCKEEIWMTHLYCQAQIARPEREKSTQLLK